MAAFPKENGSRPRNVIFTQGKDATVIASHAKVRSVPARCRYCGFCYALQHDSTHKLRPCMQVQLVPVIPLPKEKLVDTNGAGDAFVGGEQLPGSLPPFKSCLPMWCMHAQTISVRRAGFLAQVVAGKGLLEAVRAGHFAANTVIQRSGATFPPKPDGFHWL